MLQIVPAPFLSRCIWLESPFLSDWYIPNFDTISGLLTLLVGGGEGQLKVDCKEWSLMLETIPWLLLEDEVFVEAYADVDIDELLAFELIAAVVDRGAATAVARYDRQRAAFVEWIGEKLDRNVAVA